MLLKAKIDLSARPRVFTYSPAQFVIGEQPIDSICSRTWELSWSRQSTIVFSKIPAYERIGGECAMMGRHWLILTHFPAPTFG